MHLSWEGKKLDGVTRWLSWRPPFVKGSPEEPDELLDEVLAQYRVEDVHGVGRTPLVWWTKTFAYNYAYDLHRLNVWEDRAVVRAALLDPGTPASMCGRLLRRMHLTSTSCTTRCVQSCLCTSR